MKVQFIRVVVGGAAAILLASCGTAQKNVGTPLKDTTSLPQTTPDTQNTAPQKLKALTANHLSQGAIDCFEEGLKNEAGEVLTCEPSAVLFENQSLLVASDKKTIGENRAPVFMVGLENGLPQKNHKYLVRTVFQKVRKIEDFSQSPTQD